MKIGLLFLCLFLFSHQSKDEPIYINNNEINASIQHCFHKSTHNEVNVTIELYLISHKGLLLYYIDDKPHQIIVNLEDLDIPVLSIKIGYGEENLIKHHELCRCKSSSCTYQKFNFQFLINNNFSIFCNGNITSYPLVKGLNPLSNLPIYSFKRKIKPCIWLINFQMFNNKTYPNNENLSGCFFGFKFGGHLIPSNYSWSTNRCIIQCSHGICNDGECIETYHLKPICKCEKSFLNGEFCNQTLLSTSKNEKTFNFKTLKISWNWKSDIILKMVNGNKSLFIRETKENNIILEYENTGVKLTKVIPINVNRRTGRVLLLQVDGKSLIVKLKNKRNEWSKFKFDLNEDLSFDNYTLINFLNEDFVKGDVVYKSTFEDEDWKGAFLYRNDAKDIPKINKNYFWMLLILLILFVVIVVR